MTFGTAVLANLCSPAAYTIDGATFPAANVNLGGGNLGDTITVTAPTGLAFRTTGTAPSKILVGNTAIATSDTAWILSRTATTITAFAKRGGGGPLSVTNLLLGASTVISKLTTPAAMPVDSVVSDFSSAATKATARLTVIPASNVDTTYGRVNCPDASPTGACVGTTAVLDYTTFVTAASQKISFSVGLVRQREPVQHRCQYDRLDRGSGRATL